MSKRKKIKINPKARTKISLYDIMVALYIMHFFLPVIGYKTPTAAYGVLTMALFLYSCFIISKNADARLLLFFFPLFLIPIIGATKYISDFDKLLVYLYGELQIYIWGLMSTVYIVKADKKKIRGVLIFVLICCLITAVTTIIGLKLIPGASRLLATDNGDDSFNQYKILNIGGFSYIYIITLLIPIIILLMKKKQIWKIFGICSIILFFITIIMSEYTTALLIAILLSVTIFVPNLNAKKAFALLIICLIAFFVLRGIMTQFFYSLAESSDSLIRTSRYQYLADTLAGKEVTDSNTSGDRIELYKRSIEAFLSSYCLGVWHNGEIGGHSFVFDTMGNYGVLGILLIIVAYCSYFRRIIKPFLHKDDIGYIVVFFIALIILSIINPMMTLQLMIFIVPLVLSLVFDGKITRNKFVAIEEKK